MVRTAEKLRRMEIPKCAIDSLGEIARVVRKDGLYRPGFVFGVRELRLCFFGSFYSTLLYGLGASVS